MFDIIKAFKCKLFLWERQLKNEDLKHFPTCNKNKCCLDYTASYQKYAEKFRILEQNFKQGFKYLILWMTNLVNFLQMEVIEIQWDSNLKAKFIEVDESQFYKYFPTRFENTFKFV